ncbi:MAG TPA: TrbI/VirB10 family protein, partial [Candidatus Saccharimonadia bacterium]|nr:TrbI/VirB10 family protein [Candidatus Saccharimonadia bacterium]
TYLPCQVETAISSDVEGYFVANVTSVVWDTETGKHALVPPGSKILGNTQSNKLVFGSERLDTISLKLRLPTGREVELKNAPVTDEQGAAGLTGDVNRHLLRVYGAVFLTGVLKGGTAAMQSSLAGTAGANQVAVSVAGTGSQTTSRLAGPLIDTRPTIKVSAGQLCQVILLESLSLPAAWQPDGTHAVLQGKLLQTKGR